MLAVSGIASAEQDVLKDIKFSTEVRQGWQDRDGKVQMELVMRDLKRIIEQEQE